MNTSNDARNPVELLAEDFLDRKRRGERPTLREYVERHPELAEEIRDLFPALLMMEDLGESSGGTTGSLAADNGVAVGTRLERLGDYRILREIGRGGMGVVYEAEQESLGRRVALKVLSAGSLLDPKQVRRFEREAKAAARLHHTNIVPVFGVGRQDGHHYFVMQFIAGLGLDAVLEDLRRLRQAKSRGRSRSRGGVGPVAGLSAAEVARSLITGRFAAEPPLADASVTEPGDDAARRRPPPRTARRPTPPRRSCPARPSCRPRPIPDRQFYRSVARIGIQVAEALEYANRQGVLHRDVKPSNLLLDNRGNVWVADFGLAKTAEADDLTHTGDILGTIRYMAPERFQGKCDARSRRVQPGLDLVRAGGAAAGVRGLGSACADRAGAARGAGAVEEAGAGVPRDLETIIAKASARDPAGRYATAGALAEDLKRFVEDRPIRARRVSAAERLARWCRRNPWIAGSMGVAAAALVAVAVMALVHARRQAMRRTSEIVRLAGDLKKESGTLRSSGQSQGRAVRVEPPAGDAQFRARPDRLRAGPDRRGDDLDRRVAADGDRGGGPGLEAHRPGQSLGLAAPAPRAEGGLPPRAGHLVGRLQPQWPDDLHRERDDRRVRFWDAATGRPIGQPIEHSGGVSSVAFSPDGRTILTGSMDKTARLWDAATGRQLGQPMPHLTRVLSVAFSPDGKILLTGCADGGVRQWDAATGRTIGPLIDYQDPVDAVAFSPDGRSILSGGHLKTARLWDAATGRQIGQTMEHRKPGLGGGVQPRWPDDPHGEPERDGAALGRRHRPTDRPDHGASPRGPLGGVQP